MNKQELMEELNTHLSDGCSNGAKRPPHHEECNLCDKLKDVVKSIAAVEDGIAELTEAEADKLKCTVTCVEELIHANKSIDEILDRLIILEGFTILKLKTACACKKKEKRDNH